MPNPKLDVFFDILNSQALKAGYPDVHMMTLPSDVLPPQADVRTRLTRNLSLGIPIVASPMDTVTGEKMAIAMAENGGIAIFHRNMTPEDQQKKVRRVKRRRNGRIDTPISVPESMTIAEFKAWRKQDGKEHIDRFPVWRDSEKFISGLLAMSDLDFCLDESQLLKDVMVPTQRLLSMGPDTSLEEAYHFMHKSRIKVLPLFKSRETGGPDNTREIAGMYSWTDAKHICSGAPSLLNLDSKGQLVVGAAIGAGSDAMRRLELLSEVGCDVVLVDVAHGAHSSALKVMREAKCEFPAMEVIGGNISSGDGARAIADTGVDAVGIGQGCGAACTTRLIAGVGAPQVSAIDDAVRALEPYRIPGIADGGVRYSGDVAVGLATGAESAIIGKLLAAADESPGEKVLYQGRWMKPYRGMGSIGAMEERMQNRYLQDGATKLVPEGVEGYVDCSGPVSDVLAQLIGGLRSSMGYLGASNLREFRERADLFRVMNQQESHPRMIITREAPNYHS